MFLGLKLKLSMIDKPYFKFNYSLLAKISSNNGRLKLGIDFLAKLHFQNNFVKFH